MNDTTALYAELEIAARVDAGVRTLDLHVPEWRRAITLADLNLSSGDLCVLGQVATEFDLGRNVHEAYHTTNGFVRASEALVVAEGLAEPLPPGRIDYDGIYGAARSDIRAEWAHSHGFLQNFDDDYYDEETELLEAEWRERIDAGRVTPQED